MRKSIKEWVDTVHSEAKAKGWWDVRDETPNGPNFPEKLALIHSEVSEALEDYRAGHHVHITWYDEGTGKPNGIPTELADVMIRVMDLCGYYGIDIEMAIANKHAYNTTRAFRHGGKKA